MQTTLNVNLLSKNYGESQVLKNINMTIKTGEIVVLLGENGSGKTTLLNSLLGLTKPSTGSVSITQGCSTISHVQAFGASLQFAEFFAHLTVKETLNFVAAHYTNLIRIDELIESFQLKQFIDKRTTVLSFGQKKRLSIALAFIGDPPLILLDEPTIGMDIFSRNEFWRLIQLYKHKKGILLTTHYMEEAEKVADRILIIKDGSLKPNEWIEARRQLSEVSFELQSYFPLENIEQFRIINNRYFIKTLDAVHLLRELFDNHVPNIVFTGRQRKS